MLSLSVSLADKREFVKISQAVGFGFLVMGAIGYVIKLSEPTRTATAGSLQQSTLYLSAHQSSCTGSICLSDGALTFVSRSTYSREQYIGGRGMMSFERFVSVERAMVY